MFYFSLGILILTEGTSLFRRRRSFVFKYIFVGGIILIFGLLFYQSLMQYRVWSQNELSKFLLPPYQSVTYFLGYSFTHFFKNHLISLAAALLFLAAAFLLNKKFQERFFKKEELYLGALAIFLVVHPWWLYYIITILIIGVFGTLFLRIINLRTSDVINGTSDVQRLKRFPFYHFWIPAAIILIIIKIFLV